MANETVPNQGDKVVYNNGKHEVRATVVMVLKPNSPRSTLFLKLSNGEEVTAPFSPNQALAWSWSAVEKLEEVKPASTGKSKKASEVGVGVGVGVVLLEPEPLALPSTAMWQPNRVAIDEAK